MLTFTNITIGQEAETKDIYLHFADVQDQVVSIWSFAPTIGWNVAATVLSGILDLLMQALEDGDHPLIVDLRFLVELAGTHYAVTRGLATRQAAVPGLAVAP